MPVIGRMNTEEVKSRTTGHPDKKASEIFDSMWDDHRKAQPAKDFNEKASDVIRSAQNGTMKQPFTYSKMLNSILNSKAIDHSN